MVSLKRNSSSRRRSDAPFVWLLAGAAAVTAGVVLLIAFFLVKESAPLLAHTGGTPFFLDNGWHPTEGAYGLSPMLAATLAAAVGAVLLATPLGIASALFSRFYAPPRLARAYRSLVALLAGIPSVVYGLWGLTVLVPLIAKLQPPGASLLAGVLVLSLMILPTIALIADASLAAVPASFLRGAAALGLSREATIVAIALPAARTGIGAGILLAAARALGETMAVLMVAGNVVQVPSSLFDPVRTLTANIALEMAYATGDHRAALFVSGLALMALVLVLAGLAWRWGGGRVHA
jgi:phosphate transport system permease protein